MPAIPVRYRRPARLKRSKLTELQKLRNRAARNASGTVIEVEDLHKDYGDIAAVDGITFSVEPGETFGLLGPNGAGKTTTMRMLAGLSPATSGTIAVAGINVIKDNRAVRELMGVVTQHDGLDGGLTVFQNLFLYGFLAGLSRARSKKRAHEVLEFFSLRDRSKANVYELSVGKHAATGISDQRRLAITNNGFDVAFEIGEDEPPVIGVRDHQPVAGGIGRDFAGKGERCLAI